MLTAICPSQFPCQQGKLTAPRFPSSVVILISAMRQGPTPRRVRENERPGQHGGRKLANISRVVADYGVICVTSADRKWTLGTLWENAHQVFNNPDGALACLHSDAMISQLAQTSRLPFAAGC